MRIALSCCLTVVLVAGCNGQQVSTMPASSFPELKAPVTIHDQKSGAAASNQDFVYVGATCYSSCGSAVSVYTFPEGQLIGSWTGANESVPSGECADGAGNVFVTYTDFTSGYIGEILKFAHGGTTPVATLSDGAAFPVACSVDPIGGDLAVINGLNSSLGTLLIYPNASGTPTTYSYPGVAFYGVSYDNKGNIFVDGVTPSPSSKLILLELRKRATSFENITLNVQFSSAGALDWNGKHLTLGLSSSIYQFDVQGASGRLASVTKLRRSRGDGIGQYEIVGKQIIVAYQWKPCHAICGFEGAVGVWYYPSGRAITKSITPSYLSPPTGMALSFPQSHR